MAHWKNESVLGRAGILPKVRAKGITPDFMMWRRPGGEPVKILQGLKDAHPMSTVICPVITLSRLLYEELRAFESLASVRFGHQVASAGQDGKCAWIVLQDGQRLGADYVVGCDGASSAVRKSLFGKTFPGKTWDKMIVGTDVSVNSKSALVLVGFN